MTKKLNRARAVADVSSGTILATVEIASPPERVFTALTSADDVVKWWGSADSYRTTEWTMKLEPGTPWRGSGVGSDGTPFSVEGEVLEVDAPRRLVWTWRAAWDGGNTTKVTYTLEPIDGGTRVTLRHEGFADRHDACRMHGEGWERVLGWAKAHLSASTPGDAAAKRYAFCKLVPPRSTFPGDMKPEEAQAMGEHAAYLRARAEAGSVIVAGPVAASDGPWGLCVLEVESADEAAAITAEDPIIRAGLGFRYEVTPMMSAILPG